MGLYVCTPSARACFCVDMYSFGMSFVSMSACVHLYVYVHVFVGRYTHKLSRVHYIFAVIILAQVFAFPTPPTLNKECAFCAWLGLAWSCLPVPGFTWRPLGGAGLSWLGFARPGLVLACSPVQPRFSWLGLAWSGLGACLLAWPGLAWFGCAWPGW